MPISADLGALVEGHEISHVVLVSASGTAELGGAGNA